MGGREREEEEEREGIEKRKGKNERKKKKKRNEKTEWTEERRESVVRVRRTRSTAVRCFLSLFHKDRRQPLSEVSSPFIF